MEGKLLTLWAVLGLGCLAALPGRATVLDDAEHFGGDDLASELKQFDSAYDSTVSSTWHRAEKDAKKTGEKWASANGGASRANKVLQNKEHETSLYSLEHELNEAAVEEESKAQPRPHHKELGESAESNGQPQKRKAVPLPPKPKGDWMTTEQYNAYHLDRSMGSHEQGRLQSWMSIHGMPSQAQPLNNNEGKRWRIQDLSYAYQLGHYKAKYEAQIQAQEKRDAESRAFISTADYAKKFSLSTHDATQLEHWMLQHSMPHHTTPDLGESKSVKNIKSHTKWRLADIQYSVRLGEWKQKAVKFATVAEHNKNMSLRKQHKLAVWMKTQNFPCQRVHKSDLGESAAKPPQKNMKQMEKDYIQTAMATKWRADDIKYALDKNAWRDMSLGEDRETNARGEEEQQKPKVDADGVPNHYIPTTKENKHGKRHELDNRQEHGQHHQHSKNAENDKGGSPDHVPNQGHISKKEEAGSHNHDIVL